jgi:hypothetical protein
MTQLQQEMLLGLLINRDVTALLVSQADQPLLASVMCTHTRPIPFYRHPHRTHLPRRLLLK